MVQEPLVQEPPADIVKLEEASKPEEVHVPHVDEAAKEEVKV